MKILEMKIIKNDNTVTLVGNDMKIVVTTTDDMQIECSTIYIGSTDFTINKVYTKEMYKNDFNSTETSVKVKVDDYNRFICIV